MNINVLLVLMGLIWVLITLSLKNKIKKLWLYTLFPTIIYSLPLVYTIIVGRDMKLFSILALIYIYVLIRSVKGFKLGDTILIPLIIIGLNLITQQYIN